MRESTTLETPAERDEAGTGGDATSTPEVRKAPTEVPPLDTRVVEKAKGRFGVEAADLASIEGFSDLSVGRQTLLLQNLMQLNFGRMQEDAFTQYREEVGNAGFFRRLWLGATKKYQVAKQEKLSARKLEEGGIAMQRLLLEQLVKGAKDGPEAVLKEDGSLEIHYLTDGKVLDVFRSSGKEEALDRVMKERMEEFNAAAHAFSAVPYEWSLQSAPSSQRARFEETAAQFAKVKDLMLRALARRTSEKEALSASFEWERDIKLQQFLNTHPDVEQAILNTRDASVWRQFLNTTFAERGAYFAAGFAARTAAMTFLGTWALPAAAAGMGGVIAYRRGEETLREDVKKARRGGAKKVETRKTGRIGEDLKDVIITRERTDYIDAARLTARLEKLMAQVSDPENTDVRVSVSHLARLAEYADGRVKAGLVDFGELERAKAGREEKEGDEGGGRVAASSDFFSALGRAQALAALHGAEATKSKAESQGKENVYYSRVEKALGLRTAKIAKEERRYLIKETLKGVGISLASWKMGQLARDWFDAPAEAAETQDVGPNRAYGPAPEPVEPPHSVETQLEEIERLRREEKYNEAAEVWRKVQKELKPKTAIPQPSVPEAPPTAPAAPTEETSAASLKPTEGFPGEATVEEPHWQSEKLMEHARSARQGGLLEEAERLELQARETYAKEILAKDHLEDPAGQAVAKRITNAVGQTTEMYEAYVEKHAGTLLDIRQDMAQGKFSQERLEQLRNIMSWQHGPEGGTALAKAAGELYEEAKGKFSITEETLDGTRSTFLKALGEKIQGGEAEARTLVKEYLQTHHLVDPSISEADLNKTIDTLGSQGDRVMFFESNGKMRISLGTDSGHFLGYHAEDLKFLEDNPALKTVFESFKDGDPKKLLRFLADDAKSVEERSKLFFQYFEAKRMGLATPDMKKVTGQWIRALGDAKDLKQREAAEVFFKAIWRRHHWELGQEGLLEKAVAHAEKAAKEVVAGRPAAGPAGAAPVEEAVPQRKVVGKPKVEKIISTPAEQPPVKQPMQPPPTQLREDIGYNRAGEPPPVYPPPDNRVTQEALKQIERHKEVEGRPPVDRGFLPPAGPQEGMPAGVPVRPQGDEGPPMSDYIPPPEPAAEKIVDMPPPHAPPIAPPSPEPTAVPTARPTPEPTPSATVPPAPVEAPPPSGRPRVEDVMNTPRNQEQVLRDYQKRFNPSEDQVRRVRQDLTKTLQQTQSQTEGIRNRAKEKIEVMLKKIYGN